MHVNLVEAVLLPSGVAAVSAAAGPHVNIRVGFAGQRERHVAVDRGDRRRNPGEGVCDPATDGGVGGRNCCEWVCAAWPRGSDTRARCRTRVTPKSPGHPVLGARGRSDARPGPRLAPDGHISARGHSYYYVVLG